MPEPTLPRFAVLVPVKPAARAKTRLAPLGDEARRALVTAMAADTVAAALRSPLVDEVMVVTDDHLLAADLAALGASVVPDATTEDLNETLAQAAAEMHRRWPALRPVAMCADLPALDPTELTDALTVAAAHDRAFVADTDGTGTTILTARDLTSFTPRFGAGSRAAHAREGAHEIDEVTVPTLRRDVDTPADLAEALELGAGTRTTTTARGLRL